MCSHDIRVEWFHVPAVTLRTALVVAVARSERGMELEINFNLNYKMRDGKILHKGLRFWGGG